MTGQERDQPMKDPTRPMWYSGRFSRTLNTFAVIGFIWVILDIIWFLLP